MMYLSKFVAKLDGKPKEYQNELGITYNKEDVVGLTTEDLGKQTDEDPNDIRKKYLDPLINHGLVQKTTSVKDGRTNIYSLPDNSQNNDNNDKDTIFVKDPSLYPHEKCYY